MDKTTDGWLRIHNKILIKKHPFPSYHKEAWVELFIQYNALLSSSGVAERMFSSAGDILRAKRISPAAINFEQLGFMHGNMDY